MIGQSGIAVKHITRADPASVAELSKHGVATVHEAQSRTGLIYIARRILVAAPAFGSAPSQYRAPQHIPIPRFSLLCLTCY